MSKLVRILIIAVLLCTTLLPINIKAITLGEYEKELNQYLAEAEKNKNEINKTESEINKINAELEKIKNEMQSLTDEVTRIHKEITEYTLEIQEKSLQTKEIFQYFQMSQGENTYMEYVFGAESITEMIYRYAIVEQMTEYNNKITKELEELIEANNQREKEIEEINKELKVKKENFDKKLVELGTTKTQLGNMHVQLEKDIKDARETVQLYRDLGCESHHIIGVDCATGTSGNFRRPVSWGYITSEFGYRWGSYHTGVDISNWDPYNTKIYPVANGIVQMVKEDIYGALMVAIVHYDVVNKQYYTSLYAHLNSYAPGLKKGMYVTTEDFIGYMGNTGYSTGPHLHLEVTPCMIYGDNCWSFDAFLNYGRIVGENGYLGPRSKINFPSTYTYWYNR